MNMKLKSCMVGELLGLATVSLVALIACGITPGRAQGTDQDAKDAAIAFAAKLGLAKDELHTSIDANSGAVVLEKM